MIHLKNVSKTYRKKVLGTLSLDVQAGERIALVGANGAGKTTLIRTILGQLTYEGVVRVFGLEPRTQREAVLSQIAFVPQIAPPLRMPVGELLRFSAEVSGAAVADFRAIASRLNLAIDDVLAQPFSKLSGGQKQKILIAIALGRSARLLILDEPAANLDPEARRGLFSLLAERNDVAMLISSHRLDEVADLVNRVLELDQGLITLDERVSTGSDLETVLACCIRTVRSEAAFSKALHEWGFSDDDSSTTWQGRVRGADRLRFLGMLSRYSGLLNDLNLERVMEAKE